MEFCLGDDLVNWLKEVIRLTRPRRAHFRQVLRSNAGVISDRIISPLLSSPISTPATSLHQKTSFVLDGDER